MQDIATARQRAQNDNNKSNALPFAERLGYTPSELAAALGKAPSTVYRLIYAGKLKICKGGLGRMFIPRAEVDALLSNVEVYNPPLAA